MALDSYATEMSVENKRNSPYLTKQMDQLVHARKKFYTQYFQQGLHFELINVHSHFDTSSVIQLSENEYKVTEIVTLIGKSILQVAVDYPVYQAYLLAVELAENHILSNYIESKADDILFAVQESIDMGVFEILIVNNHVMQFNAKTGMIKSDAFSSEANDDSGTDKVDWINGEAIRFAPDFE